MLFCCRLENCFKIDRDRMIARRDHVLLVHVVGNETVKEREPRAGALEEAFVAFLVGTPGVIDEFGPPVAITRNRTHAFELGWRVRAIQSSDSPVPRNIKPQILRIVDDSRTIGEGDDADRSATVVWVGEVPFDLSDWAICVRTQNIAADDPKVGGKAYNELA